VPSARKALAYDIIVGGKRFLVEQIRDIAITLF
jgi:hypothetical protein